MTTLTITQAKQHLRFGSPGPEARDFVVVHEGEHQTVTLSLPAYAESFHDRPLQD